MANSKPVFTIRPALASDVDVAVELILAAAESLLVGIFGGGDKQITHDFLTNAWTIKHSQFGYGQHIVVCVDGEVAGICTHWQKDMPEVFAKDTAKSIVDFYTLEQAQDVIARSKAATYAILVPKEASLIIGHVAVLVKFRRLGLAAKLVSFVENIALQKSKTILALDVEQDNHTAIAFYRSIGFVEDSEGPDRSPFMHMIKALPPKV